MSTRSPRCTSRTIWVGGAKRQYGDVRIWCRHPVSGELVQIRHWKDLKTLESAARNAGMVWDHRTAYLTGLLALTKDAAKEAERALQGEDSEAEVAYGDERTARGKPTPLVDAETASILLLSGSPTLNGLGVTQLAWSLLGEHTTFEVLEAVAQALEAGETPRLVLVGAAAPTLTTAQVEALLRSALAPDLHPSQVGRFRGDLPRALEAFAQEARSRVLEELCEETGGDGGRLVDEVAAVAWSLRAGGRTDGAESWRAGREAAQRCLQADRDPLPPTGLEHMQDGALEVHGPLTVTQERRRGAAVLLEEVQSDRVHGRLRLRLPRTRAQLGLWGSEVGGVRLGEGGTIVAVLEDGSVAYVVGLEVEDGRWSVVDVQAQGRAPVPTQVIEALQHTLDGTEATLWWGMEQ